MTVSIRITIKTGLQGRTISRTLLTQLHSIRPKLYTILAFLSALGLRAGLPGIRIVYNFGLSECTRVKAGLPRIRIIYNFGLSEYNRVKPQALV